MPVMVGQAGAVQQLARRIRMSPEFGFRFLLGGILVSYILAIAIPGNLVSAPVRVAALGGVLLLAIRSRRKAGALGLPAFIFAVVLFGATLVSSIFASDKTLAIVANCATILLIGAAMAVLGTTLIRLGSIDQTTVNGVLCIYLLLALLFSSINEFFGTLVSPYLHGASMARRASDMLYYSVITLTTVGYGDISPASSVAQAVSVTEALIGQLYLVSVVAAVVGRSPGRNRDQ